MHEVDSRSRGNDTNEQIGTKDETVSRIHDALKKAEEQRLAALGRSPETSAPNESSFANPAETLLPAGGLASNATQASLDTDTHASAPDRLQTCPRTVWSPTRNAIFLSAQSNNAPGMEEFRTLRAKLFQLRAKKPVKRILVSSALPGEGKSFVSANLAQAFARQRGTKALLIDADLRKPHCHVLLGAPSTPGLYEYLAGVAGAYEIIQRSSIDDDLYFIPGGNGSSGAAELIGNGRMQQLLDTLAPLFTWIIIDSSPVIPVSDPTRVVEHCDGVLLVVRADSTPQAAAERAKRDFQHAPVLGIVFNQANVSTDPYYSYSYSYSEYSR